MIEFPFGAWLSDEKVFILFLLRFRCEQLLKISIKRTFRLKISERHSTKLFLPKKL